MSFQKYKEQRLWDQCSFSVSINLEKYWPMFSGPVSFWYLTLPLILPYCKNKLVIPTPGKGFYKAEITIETLNTKKKVNTVLCTDLKFYLHCEGRILSLFCKRILIYFQNHNTSGKLLKKTASSWINISTNFYP